MELDKEFKKHHIKVVDACVSTNKINTTIKKFKVNNLNHMDKSVILILLYIDDGTFSLASI